MLATIVWKPINPKKTRTELELLDKSELIDKILELEIQNEQLQMVLAKTTQRKSQKAEIKTGRPFDFSKWHKRHILLKFYYLGWDYHGFATQEETQETIEHHLFMALRRSCCIEDRTYANYNRCGRTDKGVSAFSQVISLDVRSKLEPDKQDNVAEELLYCRMLNRLLPRNIRCIAWSPAPENFSARFNCKYRKYKYFFPKGNLDINAMDQAVKYTIGEHDFRNICKMDVSNGVTNFKRTVIDAKVLVTDQRTEGSTGYDMCELEIISYAFLWHQIRCLMGVLLLIGQKKEDPDIILKLLDIETCPQKPQYNMAHEVPLSLWDCEYNNVKWFVHENELLKTIKILQQDWAFNTIKSTMIKNMLSELGKLSKCSDINFQNNCLLLGVQSRIYKPLMERETCESLENKIKHCQKKQKITF